MFMTEHYLPTEHKLTAEWSKRKHAAGIQAKVQLKKQYGLVIILKVRFKVIGADKILENYMEENKSQRPNLKNHTRDHALFTPQTLSYPQNGHYCHFFTLVDRIWCHYSCGRPFLFPL